jgi:FAD dependent oxidoreductase TIGR03364
MTKYDIIIVGGGILGLSHAYHALKAGKKVLLLEKNSMALGASVRNFGQIVPSGFGERWQTLGRASLRHYADIQSKADISIRQEGSIYIASDDEEMLLLEELAAINKSRDYTSVLWNKSACLFKYPNLHPSYVKGGLFFPEEWNADSRKTIPALALYLQSMGMEAGYQKMITDLHATDKEVILFDNYGEKWIGDQVVLCNGDEFSLLFPELFRESDIELVKLQMMETVPQRKDIIIPGSVLTGRTIRRYESFKECPSYPMIAEKQDKSAYEEQFGIHILFKQTAEGTVIIGDSHEYAPVSQSDQLKPFETDEELNGFMLFAANRIMDIDYSMMRTWNGMYSQSKSGEIFSQTIDEKIHIATAIGGKGMTGSLGWAEKNIATIFGL